MLYKNQILNSISKKIEFPSISFGFFWHFFVAKFRWYQSIRDDGSFLYLEEIWRKSQIYGPLNINWLSKSPTLFTQFQYLLNPCNKNSLILCSGTSFYEQCSNMKGKKATFLTVKITKTKNVLVAISNLMWKKSQIKYKESRSIHITRF